MLLYLAEELKNEFLFFIVFPYSFFNNLRGKSC
jgi:hypothetical protein